jgi:hypothetical protein
MKFSSGTMVVVACFIKIPLIAKLPITETCTDRQTDMVDESVFACGIKK